MWKRFDRSSLFYEGNRTPELEFVCLPADLEVIRQLV